MKTSILHIEYERSTDIGGQKGEITERYVIPTFTPPSNMKAIDVSNLTEVERQKMLDLANEYNEYRDHVMATVFSFNDWLEMTKGDTTTPIVWRTFKPENMKVLD